MKRLFILVLTFTALNIGSVYAELPALGLGGEVRTEREEAPAGPAKVEVTLVNPEVAAPKKDSFDTYMENGGLTGFFGLNLNPLLNGLGWAEDKDCRMVTNASGDQLAAVVGITAAWSGAETGSSR